MEEILARKGILEMYRGNLIFESAFGNGLSVAVFDSEFGLGFGVYRNQDIKFLIRELEPEDITEEGMTEKQILRVLSVCFNWDEERENKETLIQRIKETVKED